MFPSQQQKTGTHPILLVADVPASLMERRRVVTRTPDRLVPQLVDPRRDGHTSGSGSSIGNRDRPGRRRRVRDAAVGSRSGGRDARPPRHRQPQGILPRDERAAVAGGCVVAGRVVVVGVVMKTPARRARALGGAGGAAGVHALGYVEGPGHRVALLHHVLHRAGLCLRGEGEIDCVVSLDVEVFCGGGGVVVLELGLRYCSLKSVG